MKKRKLFYFGFKNLQMTFTFRSLKRTAPEALAPPAVGGKAIRSVPSKNPYAANHQCENCGKYGHFSKQCLNAPPPERRISNLPKANVRKVLTLDGIDTSNKTVIKNSDGTYDIFEPSASGLDQLKRDSQISKLNLSDVPVHLKCILSGTLLNEAVELPCCKKIVNDTIVRDHLLKSSHRCPLCATPNVSPDSVGFLFFLLLFYSSQC